jgi:hypothetical protein
MNTAIAEPAPPPAPPPALATFNRHAVRSAMDRGGVTLRTWQRTCLIDQTATAATDAGMVSAVMGAGKSIVIALLCAAWSGPVVVTTSTIKLVEQLSEEIRRLTGEPVGVYYTGGKSTSRITVTCLPSVERLANVLGHVPGLLWLADEAHRCERDTVAAFLTTCQPARRIGFSATPYRSDGGLTIWTHEAHRYSLDDGIREGSLVPFRIVLWTRRLADELGVPFEAPKRPDDAENANDANDAVIAWCRSQSGPGVISAANIADAEEFAAECCAQGYPVQAVHSRMSKKAVKGAIERLRTGELAALVHCHMLSEGVDMPWLRWMALRQGRGSRVEFLQEFGRVLRAAPGKTEAVIFDPWEKSLDHPMTGWLEVADDADAGPASEKEPDPTEDPLTGEEFEWDELPEKERKRILATGEIRAYLSTAIVALTAGGQLDPIGGSASKWRFNPASEKQTAFLVSFSKTAGAAQNMRGYLGYSGAGAQNDEQAAHVRAVAKAVKVLVRVIENGGTLRSGIVSDACSLARCLFRGHGKNRADTRPPAQVQREAFECLERYSVDPSHVLNG